MTSLKSATLDSNQKKILRQAIFFYVSDLQRQFYQDKSVTGKDYDREMESISQIVEVLHLKNCYRQEVSETHLSCIYSQGRSTESGETYTDCCV